MIMADVLKYFLVIVGLLVVFVSYWLAAQALFPEFVARAREQYARPLRATILGLVCAAPFIAFALALFKNAKNPVMNIVGFATLGIPVFLGLGGSAGLAQRIGCGMASPLDAEQPWRRTLRGGIVLAFTYLLPFVGWLGLTIWTLVSGFGVAISVLRGRKRADAAARAQASVPVPPVAAPPVAAPPQLLEKPATVTA